MLKVGGVARAKRASIRLIRFGNIETGSQLSVFWRPKRNAIINAWDNKKATSIFFFWQIMRPQYHYTFPSLPCPSTIQPGPNRNTKGRPSLEIWISSTLAELQAIMADEPSSSLISHEKLDIHSSLPSTSAFLENTEHEAEIAETEMRTRTCLQRWQKQRQQQQQ